MKKTFCPILFLTILIMTATPRISRAYSAPDPPDALEILRLSIKEMKRQDSLLAGYVCLKTVITEHLNEDLSPKRTETKLFEVTSVPDGPDIEILVSVDGEPVPEKEREKSKSKQESGHWELSSEELLELFDWNIGGRELVNDRPSTVLRFEPRPGAVYEGDNPKTEKFVTSVHGKAWVDDKEHVISRIEFASTKPIKSLAGIFWTLHSFHVIEERQRLPGGVWIDSKGEYFVDATALFFKKIRRRSVMHTHDYKPPFVVDGLHSSESSECRE
jgi:hypothetical protein